MLRELLDRLCRRGDFEPIVEEDEDLARWMREMGSGPIPEEETPVDRLERSDYVYTPSAIDLSGVETTFDPTETPRMRVDDLLPHSEVRATLQAPRGRGWPHEGLVFESPGWIDEPGVEAQAIVRMLALAEPSCAVDDPARVCHICDAWGNDVEHFAHEPTCPYQRAVEWVRANPA